MTNSTSISIVTEVCSTMNLKEWLKKQDGKKLTEKDLKPLMKELLEILKYLKEKNVTHRDIKL